MQVSYYAIFNYGEYDKKEKKYGISISFPDIPLAITCARNDEEGIAMALEVLQLSLLDDEGKHITAENLPEPTPPEQIILGNKKFLLRLKKQSPYAIIHSCIGHFFEKRNVSDK